MIPPKAPASTTLRNARTYALRDGSPAGTSESPGLPGSSPPPLLVGSSSITPPLSQAPARHLLCRPRKLGLLLRRPAKPPPPRAPVGKAAVAAQRDRTAVDCSPTMRVPH